MLYNNYNKIPKELETKQSCPISVKVPQTCINSRGDSHLNNVF